LRSLAPPVDGRALGSILNRDIYAFILARCDPNGFVSSMDSDGAGFTPNENGVVAHLIVFLEM
jgi:hypothetical protein